MDLILNFMFFLELEFMKRDLFNRKFHRVGEVEQFFLK